MRLLALTPIDVPDAEVARRQARYDAIAPAGVTGRGAAARTAACRASWGRPTTSRPPTRRWWRRTPREPAATGTASCPTACSTPRSTPRPSLPRPDPRHRPAGDARPRRRRAGLARASRATSRSPTSSTGWRRATASTTDGPTTVLSLSRRGHRRRRRLGERAGRRGGRPAAATRSSTAARPSTSGQPGRGPGVVDPTALALRVLAGVAGARSWRAPHERARRPRPRRRRGRGRARRPRCARPSSGSTCSCVERQEHFAAGNNTAMSTAMVPGAGSRWQREAGHRGLARAVPRRRPGQDRRRGRRADRPRPGRRQRAGWWSGSPTTSASTSSLVTDFNYPGHSAPRCHTVPGRSGRRLLDDLVRPGAPRGRAST